MRLGPQHKPEVSIENPRQHHTPGPIRVLVSAAMTAAGPQTSAKVIAIDGPAGAGKSTVSRALADRLGFVLLDTGAIYRTLALACQQDGTGWEDEDALARKAETLPIHFKHTENGNRVLLGDRDVTDAIRTPEISQGASRISALPAVRAALLDIQRRLGREGGGVVAEGRDVGTVVFPDATAKFFLTAAPEERAHRRLREMEVRGIFAKFEEVLRDINERDARDSGREAAPLRLAEGAVQIDSDGLDIEQVVEKMAEHIRDRGTPVPGAPGRA